MSSKLTLPEFAFIEGDGFAGDILAERTVILHVRSASVCEVFECDKVALNPGTISFRFNNRNILGTSEKLIIALHYSATLDLITERDLITKEVLEPAAKWYCKYCDREEKNMLIE